MFAIWASISSLIVLFDQLTKWAIMNWLPYGDPTERINSFLQLTHRRNPGAAFSFLADAGGWQRWFFITLAVTVSAVIAVWKRRDERGPVDKMMLRNQHRSLSSR